MCTADEYLALLMKARDALSDALDETAHDSGFLMRKYYGQLEADIRRLSRERDDNAGRDKPSTEDRPPTSQGERPRCPTEGEWRRFPRAARECLLLAVLGDQRLGVWELVKALRAAHPGCFSTDYTRMLLKHLVDVGELDCCDEFPPTHWPNGSPRRGRRRRKVYFRRTPELTGAIAELEQAFHMSGAVDDVELARGSGGLDELCRFGLDNTTRNALFRQDLLLVDDIARRSDKELLRLPWIGPLRLRLIREAIAAYRQAQDGPNTTEVIA